MTPYIDHVLREEASLGGVGVVWHRDSKSDRPVVSVHPWPWARRGSPHINLCTRVVGWVEWSLRHWRLWRTWNMRAHKVNFKHLQLPRCETMDKWIERKMDNNFASFIRLTLKDKKNMIQNDTIYQYIRKKSRMDIWQKILQGSYYR